MSKSLPNPTLQQEIAMNFRLNERTGALVRRTNNWARGALSVACVLCGGLLCANAQQCSFTSPSDGSDGDYDLSATPAGTTVYFSATPFKGSGVANNVFNFGKIIIPSGVTVKFTEKVFHGPVYWLAAGDVTIAGTLDLTGDSVNYYSTDLSRQPFAAGSGGYPGGVGGGGPKGFVATAGGGPGGGAVGDPTKATNGGSGTFAGSNYYLVPLIGGSGGGGGYLPAILPFGQGGGGGGGAIMIASSTSISLNGTIDVTGGSMFGQATGSGGAVLLDATSLTFGTGATINAYGGSQGNGYLTVNAGAIRLEACGTTGNATIGGTTAITSTPVKAILPSSPFPQLQVTSINGTAITENPFTFPDITISTSSSIPLVITGHQIRIGTIPTLYVFSETGDQQLQCTGGMQGTSGTSTCTINLTFPFGGSRGFVRATWAQ
jgi:hypothetical protein